MTPVQLVILSGLTDFVIAGGGVILGGNLQSGGELPTVGVWIASVVTGAVAFAKEAKQRLQIALSNGASVTPKP
jgi:hypothetical protein